MAMQSSSLPPLDVQRAPEGGEVGAVQSGWRLALREFASNRLAVIGFAILVFFVLFCFVGPLIYHANQLDTDLTQANQPPLGPGTCSAPTTNGFDELGRIMKGGQAALEIGFFAAFVAIVIGTLWGAVAGLAGGFVDSTMMRVVDVFLSVPFLFVVLILAVKFGATRAVAEPGHRRLRLAGAGPAGPRRGALAAERDFVPAARTAGASSWRLISRHLIPNALGVIIVNVTFQRRGRDPGRRLRSASSASACTSRTSTGATCSPTAASTCRTATGG